MGVTGFGPLALAADADAELVRRAKARDAAVWAAWHDEYYDLLFRYAASRLGSREEAEDVASQVFLEALRAIGRYQYRGRPVLAWFYGIARHLVSRRLRQMKGGGQPLSDEAASLQGARGSEEEVLQSLALRSALAKLKPEHQETLRLRFLLDLPTAQVAAIMGKSEAAVHSLQVRALAALRRQLEG